MDSLHHTWVVPCLAAPLRSPEGFLDGRGLDLMSVLFPDSLGQQGQSREPGADSGLLQHLPSTWLLLPLGCSASAWTPKVRFCSSTLALESSHSTILLSSRPSCCSQVSALSRTFSSVTLAAYLCLSVLPVACVTVASPPRPS